MEGSAAFRLSLVLPAWNEQETIQQAVQEAATALAAITADYEIIVVDDGSQDATADIVRAEAVGNPRVRLVQHDGNRGYGAALRTGFQAARLDLVAFTDADCQFDLADLEYVLPLTRRYDAVTGYRINRQDPLPRRFVSWAYNNLVKVLIGSPVHDLDCALKIFHREQLPALLPQANNFFVNTEMLTQARHQGLSVVEVGVNHRPRAAGRSKVSLGDVPRTLAALLPYWWTRIMFPAAAPAPAAANVRGGVGLLVLALLAGTLFLANLAAVATVLVTYLFARRLGGSRAGFLAGLVLVLLVGLVECGQLLISDSLLGLFITLALFLAYEALQGPALTWRPWLASALCAGLGCMTGGPVVLALLLLLVVAHAWLNRLPAMPRRRHWLAYGSVVAGLVFPPLAVSALQASAPTSALVALHPGRAAGSFGPVLLLGCLPWSPLLLHLVRFLASRARAAARLRTPAMGFCVLWVGGCVVLAVLGGSAQPSAILPALPALALLLGSFLDVMLFRPGLEKRFAPVRQSVPQRTALLLGAAWLAVLAWAWWQGISMPIASWGKLAQVAACFLGIGVVTVWRTKLPSKAAWGLCALLAFFLVHVLTSIHCQTMPG